jgi:alpha/beta superfamily hydrolase
MDDSLSQRWETVRSNVFEIDAERMSTSSPCSSKFRLIQFDEDVIAVNIAKAERVLEDQELEPLDLRTTTLADTDTSCF